MNTRPIGSSPPTSLAESAEAKGAESRNDHDADDAMASKPAVNAALPPGVGTLIDKKV